MATYRLFNGGMQMAGPAFRSIERAREAQTATQAVEPTSAIIIRERRTIGHGMVGWSNVDGWLAEAVRLAPPPNRPVPCEGGWTMPDIDAQSLDRLDTEIAELTADRARLAALNAEMVGALEELLACLTYSGSVGLGASTRRQEARNTARALIAKARAG